MIFIARDYLGQGRQTTRQMTYSTARTTWSTFADWQMLNRKAFLKTHKRPFSCRDAIVRSIGNFPYDHIVIRQVIFRLRHAKRIEMSGERGNPRPVAVVACFSGVKVKGSPTPAGVGK